MRQYCKMRDTLKMARLKRFELLTHGLENRCSIQLSYRRTGRGSKIRTYDHSLPKRVRYQTALYPEVSDLKVLSLNNQSPLHKYLMMGKCLDGIKNFRRKGACSNCREEIKSNVSKLKEKGIPLPWLLF